MRKGNLANLGMTGFWSASKRLVPGVAAFVSGVSAFVWASKAHAAHEAPKRKPLHREAESRKDQNKAPKNTNGFDWYILGWN